MSIEIKCDECYEDIGRQRYKKVYCENCYIQQHNEVIGLDADLANAMDDISERDQQLKEVEDQLELAQDELFKLRKGDK